MEQVVRYDGVVEFFVTGRCIQSAEWSQLNLNQTRYNKLRKTYTKDYVNTIERNGIIHATAPDKLHKILSDGGFRPGRKSIPGCTLDSFVWFGIKIGQTEVDALKDFYTVSCKMEKQDILEGLGIIESSDVIDCSSIANSPCFEPTSRYGEFKLAFEIQNVLNAYSQQFCPDKAKPDFRILGTFIYKMEIMHTVLVCPPGTPGTSKYPLLDQKQTSVIREDPEKEGTFIWCPDSTGDKDNAAQDHTKRGPFRRWEHVTYAFYVKYGEILKLNNVSSNLSVCIYLDPQNKFEPSSINDTIQKFLSKVSEQSAIKTKRAFVNLLMRSVRGYLDDEKVFEKMNILYMYKPVDLDTVVDRVEKLLDGDDFDWSPLIKWMKDVQKTKNTAVLSSIYRYLNKITQLCREKLRINDMPQ
ncbi:hypothetical protein ACJMK2_030761 [Sinanodonta woodiana]|uniref:Uncharacterized protein n=1 Tax=Sinanodonta woodiana TaxID=1069815 RepID=A0ABD3WWD6_SINWO